MLGKAFGIINTPRKWLHALLGLGRPHKPREVALGLLLGWVIGFGPWGLHTAVPLMLMLLLRCFWPIAIAGFVAGMAVWPMAAGHGAELGHYLLSSKGMIAGWVEWASNAPILAWMGLHEYHLLGSMAIGITIGGSAALLMRVVLGVLYRFGIGRIGPWVFAKVAAATGAGKDEDESIRETLWTKGPFRVIRPAGLVGVPVLAIIVGWSGSGAAGFALEQQLTTRLSAHLGTKVTVDGVSISLAAGAVALTGLTIWDPESPERTILTVASMELDASVVGLLRRRVVAEEAVIRGLDVRIDRRPDGRLSLDDLKPYAGGERGGTGGAGSLLDWAKSKTLDAADADWAELVERLRPYLEQRGPPDVDATPEFPPPGEADAGWNMPRTEPRWLIQRAALENCTLRYGAKGGTTTQVNAIAGEIRDWSSDRDLHPQPITFTLKGTLASAGHTEIVVEGEMAPPATGGGLSLKFPNAKDALKKHLGGLFGGG